VLEQQHHFVGLHTDRDVDELARETHWVACHLRDFLAMSIAAKT
jgi:hypothetical protein